MIPKTKSHEDERNKYEFEQMELKMFRNNNKCNEKDGFKNEKLNINNSRL